MTKLNVEAAVLNVTGEFAYGSVCYDCTNMLANGENDWNKEQSENAERSCQTYEFTLGHLCLSNWADDRCYHKGDPCEDDDCECDRDEFSKSACDMCGTRDHGYRHHVIMIKRELLNTNMTQEQFNKLLDLCVRYDVKMHIDDYVVNSQDSTMMPGWVEGWVGGYIHNGGTMQFKKTIYVGVSPEGDSHS